MTMLKNGLFISYIVFTMTLSIGCAEPQCSKFPYEEALLEKMIRMEFEVQQMRDGINKVKEQVADELDKLRDTRVDLQKFTENLSKEWMRTKVQLDDTVKELVTTSSTDKTEMLNDIKVFQDQNEDKFVRISKDLVKLKNDTIKWIQENHNVTNVLFVARATKQLSFNRDQTIIFDTIISNEGNNYSGTTGVFTAPSSGNYIFSTQFCGQNNNYFEFCFMVNDNQAQQGLDYGPGASPCWNSVMTRRLAAGDRVYVNDVAGNNRLESDNHRWNLFSGILVSL